LPSSVLLKPIKEGANPEVAGLDFIRFAITTEPDRKKNILCSVMKELTGDKTLNVRGLYSSKCKINLQITLCMEANDLPRLDEVNDAIARRIDITPFTSKAVSKEDYDCAEDKIGLMVANPHYKTDEFQEEYKMSLFHLLQPYFQIFKKNNFILSQPPSIVKEQNNKYMANSDTFFDWFKLGYEECDGELVKIKDIHIAFSTDLMINMSRRDKSKITSVEKIVEEIEKNMFLKKSLKMRNQNYKGKKITVDSLVGWRKKIEIVECNIEIEEGNE
jgi:phage/plasmid-associated DNA primase